MTWTGSNTLIELCYHDVALEGTRVVRDSALHREAAEGTQNERHRGLAGRRIVGGLLITAQEPRGRGWYLWAGVCRSRVTQPEAYGVFSLPLLLPLRPVLHEQIFECFSAIWEMSATLDDGWRRLPLDRAQTARNLSFYPPGKRASTRGFNPSMDRVTRLYRGKPPNSSAITWRRRASSWDCRRRNFTPNSWPLAHRTVASSTLIGTASCDP